MAEDKKIQFGAQDTGISSFMKKVMEDGKKMYSTFADEAKKQLTSSKEQNKFIQERIRLLKEELSVQKDIAREELTRAKGLLRRNISSDAPDFVISAASRKVQEAQARLDEISGRQRASRGASSYREEERGPNVFNSVLLAGAVRDIMGVMRGLPNAQTGLDFVSPFARASGTAIGGGAGALLDLANIKILGSGLGQTNFSGLGAETGGLIGQIAGDAVTRTLRTRDLYDRSYLGYTALGGRERSMGLGGLGFAGPAVAEAMVASTKAAGTGVGARNNSALMLALSRLGFSSEGDTLAALGTQRMGGGSGAMNMQRVLAIAFSEGLDKARFSDVIKTQTQLIQHFAATSTNVNSANAARSIFEFNRMGGMFTAGDPRSLSNIMAIDRGLANPGSGFGQAQNYAVLRRLNPNADPWQLRTLESKGLQTPGFLKGVLDQIGATGFSEPLQKFMMKSRFGDMSFEAIDTLFANKEKLGSMNQVDVNKMLGTDSITKMAERHTSELMKQEAEITDAFRTDFLKGIDTVTAYFGTEMSKAIDILLQRKGITAKASGAVGGKRALKAGESYSTDGRVVITGFPQDD